LIALLRAVAYGWTQEQLAENARHISELGKELYRRLALLGDHFAKVGKGLQTACQAYDQAIGSLESRVFVTARKFQELGVAVSDDEIEELPLVDSAPRLLRAPELLREVRTLK
jgi:DNA recombination protein RmuC